jgi:hypothetical protein
MERLGDRSLGHLAVREEEEEEENGLMRNGDQNRNLVSSASPDEFTL